MKVRGWLGKFSVFGFCLLLLSIPAGAGEKITMRVTPSVAFAPANLVVHTIIQSDPDNREVEIVAESSDFYRSSAVQLDGDRAPVASRFEFTNLPSGTYHVVGFLYGSDGKTLAFAQSDVSVISGGR